MQISLQLIACPWMEKIDELKNEKLLLLNQSNHLHWNRKT